MKSKALILTTLAALSLGACSVLQDVSEAVADKDGQGRVIIQTGAIALSPSATAPRFYCAKDAATGEPTAGCGSATVAAYRANPARYVFR